MADKIPEPFKDLFAKVAYANLATVMPDGSPQVTPVWFDQDGEYLRINSAKDRIKDKNMRRNKRVAVSIQDPDNAYRYLSEAYGGYHIDAATLRKSLKKAPTLILIPWPRSIWARTSTRFAAPAKSGSSIRSAPRKFLPWVSSAEAFETRVLEAQTAGAHAMAGNRFRAASAATL